MIWINEVVEDKNVTIAPKHPLETQLEKRFNRKEAGQTDKAQCTANMIMKKTKLPVSKDGVLV